MMWTELQGGEYFFTKNSSKARGVPFIAHFFVKNQGFNGLRLNSNILEKSKRSEFWSSALKSDEIMVDERSVVSHEIKRIALTTEWQVMHGGY